MSIDRLFMLAALAAASLGSCSGPAEPTVAVTPPAATVTPPAAATDSIPPVTIWRRDDSDPAPGPIVVDQIATSLRVAPADVVAAVFILRHPAGNGAAIWVFRGTGLTSAEAATRWAAGEIACGPPAQRTSLNGLDTVIIHRSFIDQCQPEYVVSLDADTVATIIDDGGYAGNASKTSTVPYRQTWEFNSLVAWLQHELETVALQPGGPPMTDQ